jgi:hypothetical protein
MSISRNLARLALAASLVAALPAAASTFEVEGGRSSLGSVGSNSTNAAFLEAVFNYEQIGSSRFSWAPDVSLGWIDGHDRKDKSMAHPRYGVTDHVWLLAGGARFRFGNEGDWYRHLFLSEQIAGQTGRTQGLSTHYEFVTTFGAQWRYFSVQARHISNGSTGGPNRGETMLLVGVGFHF